MDRRVLLVEDNEDNRNIYRLILEHSGFHVLEAVNGQDGIRMAKQERPDVILMDISIPIIDGWEATRILKADEATRDIPIIALTAHVLVTDRAKAKEVGCDGYLAKPVEPRRVLEEVERWTDRGPTQSGSLRAEFLACGSHSAKATLAAIRTACAIISSSGAR